MRRLADERGLTLIELLVACTIMILVLGATMTLLTASTRQQRLVDQHNEAQQEVRISLDRLARDLRNLASPGDLSAAAVVSGGATQPRAIDRNLSYDLIVKAVADTVPAGSFNATNVKRVRYCLDASAPDRGKLWQQTQTWTSASPPAMPGDTACPGSGWNAGESRVVASDVANRSGGLDRAVFRYAGTGDTITGTDDGARADISRVRVDLYVDPDPARAPRAARLSTALFLRNQNREPVASFTITGINTTTRLIDLNGSGSEDPESQQLDHQFYYDPPSPLPSCADTDTADPHASCILPAAARLQFGVPTPGEHTYVLKVSDPSGLVGTSEQKFAYPPPPS